MTYDVVVPTIGRPSLRVLLERLAAASGPPPDRLIVVDDRAGRAADAPPLADAVPRALRDRTTVVRSGGGGPARARNTGLRETAAEFVAFLDDDVLIAETWPQDLAADLASLGAESAASYARIVVPLPRDRRPTDWERNVACLASAETITADAAFRRTALLDVGGFDERFPRAYREDVDLAIRLRTAGFTLAGGTRVTMHPVRPASRWISIALQAGNADDALMHAVHGEPWATRASGELAAYADHERIVAWTFDAARAFVAGNLRSARRAALRALAGVACFAASRIVRGPLTLDEIVTMTATSAVIPYAAVVHRARGERRARALIHRAKAVLFDRDGTLVRDTPIGGDAARVDAFPGAAPSVERLRAARVAIGVVTNQPGLARGAFTASEDARVRARIEELVGPIDTWAVCDHAEDAGCECRKPRPGLIFRAASALGVRPDDCVVVGDIGSDIDAARAAGARAVLVPTAITRREEIDAAPHVAATLEDAVDLILCGAV